MTLNSLSDALTGLQANQSYMNVVGNNIANVNTVGYKTQDIHFSDLLNETLRNDSSATAGGLQGTNPVQIGMGVGSGSINILNTQGTEQDTGRLTDMAIQGGGYFIVGNGSGRQMFTRDGSFNVSADGTLEMGANGMMVQGWNTLNANGTVNTTTPLGKIQLPMTGVSVGATTTAALVGNLDSSQAVYVAAAPPVAASGGSYTTQMTAYDSLGAAHQITVDLQKTSATDWSATFTGGVDLGADPAATPPTVAIGSPVTVTFDSTGNLTAIGGTTGATTTALDLSALTVIGGGKLGDSTGALTLDLSKLTQLASTSQINVGASDGSASGTLSTFSVGKDGTVTAIYSNGTSKSVGQIAMADFRNPDGLHRQGDNLLVQGANSGNPQYGQAGSGTLGTIATGQLEGSNVDLASQFGQMIQAQQGFNANTKVITTTNNMLQAVIQIVP